MPPEYRARIEAGKPRLHAIAREQHGIQLNEGPFGMDSRPAHIAAKYAEMQGKGAEYHAALMRAYWTGARDLENADELAEIADAVGVDRAGLLAALHDAKLNAAVEADIRQAAAYGLSGVPALVFADKYLISGAQPLPVLQQAVEQVQAEQAGD